MTITLLRPPFEVLCLLASQAREKDNHERGILEWIRAPYLPLAHHTTSISDKTGVSFLFHQTWTDRQFKVMMKGVDFGVRDTWVGTSVVKNSPAKAGETGSIPGLGWSHMPLGNKAHVPQLPSPHSRAHDLQLPKPACLERVLYKRSHSNEKPVHRN